ncbi:Putative gustatory receptor [Apis cerana cerana]|uniref:Gustatory receptor n=1 Tax=Apis cerana cerana TaxID=94128 RepID=A0A2A3EDC8_APICC|nr:Putative gustatory receptor [Apis cerana cerana]
MLPLSLLALLTSKLEQFSLQLLHQKVKFTANGYFTLDNTLFHSMINTVTTYMVILVQFQMGTSNQNANFCNCTQCRLSNLSAIPLKRTTNTSIACMAANYMIAADYIHCCSQ